MALMLVVGTNLEVDMSFHDVDDEETPASVMVKTPEGRVIDINNISGLAKAKLIMEGEFTQDQFTTPDNMPGKKLAALRASKNVNIQKGIDEISKDKKNKFKVGDIVRFKNNVSEVLEIDDNRVKIARVDGKIIWIHHTKAELMDQNDND